MTAPGFFATMNATADKPALPGRISRLMASHDVAVPTTGKVTVQALDKLLAGTTMSTADRIALKTSLHKAGILLDR
jgi:hypothetical protein